MMKENQKLLLLCGDSYQDISLLAAVKEAQKLVTVHLDNHITH